MNATCVVGPNGKVNVSVFSLLFYSFSVSFSRFAVRLSVHCN